MPAYNIPKNLLPSDGRFGCGPAKIRSEHLAKLTSKYAPLFGTSHRQQPVKKLVGDVKEQLATLFCLPEGYEIVLGNGGATAFWDAAAFSLIEKRSQHLSFGEFGNKFSLAAATPWLDAPEVISATPGSISHATALTGIDVYAWPQNETSTGACAPVTRIVADPNALTVIDATSAAGGMAVDLTECDVYYFSPQKNLGSDGGLWFSAFSPAALERVERVAASGRYIPEFLSLKNSIDNSRLNQTLNTPSIATLALLSEQLGWILSEGGLNWAAERTAASSDLVYSWAENSPFASPFVSEKSERSPVVTTVDFLDEVPAHALSAALRENGIVDTEPYRKLGRNQLRIATFVSVDTEDVKKLLECIDWVMERFA